MREDTDMQIKPLNTDEENNKQDTNSDASKDSKTSSIILVGSNAANQATNTTNQPAIYTGHESKQKGTRQDTIKEFIYYAVDGNYLGRSEGSMPEKDKFHQVHYIFNNSNDSDTIQNFDKLNLLRKRLTNLRKKLITTSVIDIATIMDLNQKIKQCRIEQDS